MWTIQLSPTKLAECKDLHGRVCIDSQESSYLRDGQSVLVKTSWIPARTLDAFFHDTYGEKEWKITLESIPEGLDVVILDGPTTLPFTLQVTPLPDYVWFVEPGILVAEVTLATSVVSYIIDVECEEIIPPLLYDEELRRLAAEMSPMGSDDWEDYLEDLQ